MDSLSDKSKPRISRIYTNLPLMNQTFVVFVPFVVN